jgi:hypothetical protein
VEQKYERLKKEYMNKQNEIEKLKKSRLEQLEKRKYYEKIYQSQVETEQELTTKIGELEVFVFPLFLSLFCFVFYILADELYSNY